LAQAQVPLFFFNYQLKQVAIQLKQAAIIQGHAAPEFHSLFINP
jgi:hypothetical protein